MRGHQDDDASWQPASARSQGATARGATAAQASSGSRSFLLVAGFVLAVAATFAVFLTDDPRYLRLAVIAAAWAFVLAAFLAGRRRAEQVSAGDREEELRRRYESELDRETAAHREYELELENQLRREVEDSMRTELTALRSELAELGLLRHEVARVARLGTDLPALSGLRADLASLSALREDLASLTSLREDMASVGELKADVGRLRTELSEQLNGEMLIERIVMRTQAIRTPGQQFPAEGGAPWTAEVPAAAWPEDRAPRELTGGRPAVEFDERRAPRPEPVRADRPLTSPAGLFATTGRPAEPASATAAFPLSSPAAGPAATDPADPAPPTPLEWLADRALVEPADSLGARSPAAAGGPAPVGEARGRMPGDVVAPVPPRRRRSDEHVDDATQERPAAPATAAEPGPAPRPSPHPRTAPQPVTPAPAVGEDTESAGHQRLAEILAESGAQEPPGGRRRRRYRDETGDPDDVLARVLRQD